MISVPCPTDCVSGQAGTPAPGTFINAKNLDAQ
jgi:hypothetical protein